MTTNLTDEAPSEDIATTKRIDLVLAVLSSMDTQEAHGWTLEDLAELCDCSAAAIHQRQRKAFKKIRTTAPELIQHLKP